MAAEALQCTETLAFTRRFEGRGFAESLALPVEQPLFQGKIEEKKEKPEVKEQELEIDETRVEKLVRRVYGKEISNAEKIFTAIVFAGLIALATFTAVVYWQAIVAATPFLVSLVTKKFLGFSVLGYFVSQIKKVVQTTVFSFFKKASKKYLKMEENKAKREAEEAEARRRAKAAKTKK